MKNKTKIVLDADVIIHFIKGGQILSLVNIFPELDYIVLDVVYEEVNHKLERKILDNAFEFVKQRVKKVKFKPEGILRKEYFYLTDILKLGEGESASMLYCKANKDVLGSSNITDIKQYCEQNGIIYLMTLDFLYFAYKRGLMTVKDCTEFMTTVNAKGSRLPIVDISTYQCTVTLPL